MPDEPAKHRKRDYLVACGCRMHYTHNPDEVRIYVRFNTAHKDYKKDRTHWDSFRPKVDTPEHAQYEAWQARKEQFDRLERGGPPYDEALQVVNYNEHNANLPFARYSPTVEGGTRAAARQQFVASVSSDDESSSESDSDEAAGTDVDDDPDEPYESSDEEVDDEVRHALDSINSIEDLGTIFPKLTKFAKVDEEHGRRARALVEDLVALFHDGSTMTSLSKHYERNTAIREGNTVIEKGHSMRQLWLRLQPKTVELYCCRDGHDFGEPNSSCGCNLPNGKMCKHDRIIKCTHFDLREMLHFLMRDPEFAKNVRWGLDKMDPLDAPVPRLVDTVMRSQGVKELEQRIPFRSMTFPNSLPLLMEMMVDGFQATNASRTIDTIQFGFPSLPPDMVEDYIMPIAFIDGKSIAKRKDKNVKSKSYEASLSRIVDELNSFVLEVQGPQGSLSLIPANPELVRDVSLEETGDDPAYVQVYAYLMCCVCDMKETTGVAHHSQPVGYDVCHCCDEHGADLRTPPFTGGQGSHTIIHPTTNVAGEVKDRPWTDGTARQESRRAEDLKAKGHRPSGWLGESPLCRLKYFDMGRGILVCAMHQFSNTVMKCLSLMLGEDGWNGTQLLAFLNDDTGASGDWGMNGAQWKDNSGLPWPEDVPDESKEDEISKQIKVLKKQKLDKEAVRVALQVADVPYGQRDLMEALLRKLALFQLGMQQEEEETGEPVQGGEEGAAVEADDGLGGSHVLEGVRTHNVYSKKVKNGFMAAGPWPKGPKPLMQYDRDLRMGLEWSKQIRKHSSVNGDLSQVLHFAVGAKVLWSFYKKIKASHNKDFAITMMLPLLQFYCGVHPDIVAAYADLFSSWKILCAPVVNMDDVDQVVQDTPRIFRQLETKLLPIVCVSALHATSHLPAQVLHWGVMADTASWKYEGAFSKYGRMARRNTAKQVETLVRRLKNEWALKELARIVGIDYKAAVGKEPRMPPIHPYTPRQPDGLEIDPRRRSEYTGESKPAELVKQYYESRFTHDEVPGMPPQPEIMQYIDAYDFCITEYSSLKINNRIEVQSEGRNRREQTCNEYVVLLDPRGGPRRLGLVKSIYRLTLGNTTVEGLPRGQQLLLLVEEYPLSPADVGLERCRLHDGRVVVHDTTNKPELRLVDVSCIWDVASMCPDPRVLGENGSPRQVLVLTKGQLQNMGLRNPYAQE